jgi:hypothetical protein
MPRGRHHRPQHRGRKRLLAEAPCRLGLGDSPKLAVGIRVNRRPSICGGNGGLPPHRDSTSRRNGHLAYCQQRHPGLRHHLLAICERPTDGGKKRRRRTLPAGEARDSFEYSLRAMDSPFSPFSTQ